MVYSLLTGMHADISQKQCSAKKEKNTFICLVSLLNFMIKAL